MMMMRLPGALMLGMMSEMPELPILEQNPRDVFDPQPWHGTRCGIKRNKKKKPARVKAKAQRKARAITRRNRK